MSVASSVARIVALAVFVFGWRDRCVQSWGIPVAIVLAACYFPAVRAEDDRLAWRLFIPIALLCSLKHDGTVCDALVKLGWRVPRISFDLLFLLPFVPLVAVPAARAARNMPADARRHLINAIETTVLAAVVGLGAMAAHFWVVVVPVRSHLYGCWMQATATFALTCYGGSCVMTHRLDPDGHFQRLGKPWKTVTMACLGLFATGVLVGRWY
jgi:hypothetical protein